MRAKPVRCLTMTSGVGQWFQELGRATADNLSFRGFWALKRGKTKLTLGTTRGSRSSKDTKQNVSNIAPEASKQQRQQQRQQRQQQEAQREDNAVLLDVTVATHDKGCNVMRDYTSS